MTPFGRRLQPAADTTMMRAGAAVVLAETVGSIKAARRGPGRCVGSMDGAMNSIPARRRIIVASRSVAGCAVAIGPTVRARVGGASETHGGQRQCEDDRLH